MTRLEALKRLKAIKFMEQFSEDPQALADEATQLKGEFGINDLEVLNFCPNENGMDALQAEYAEYAAAAVNSSGILQENAEKKGLEIRFTSPPGKEVTEKLKKAGWRYHGRFRLWYIRKTDEALAFAQGLVGNTL